MKNSLLFICCFAFLFCSSFGINNAKAQLHASISGNSFSDIYLGGEVTKEKYDDFWKGVGVKTRQEKEAVVKSMRNNFLLIQEYQAEVWNCAQQAWNLHKVPQCDNLKKKFKLLSKNLNNDAQKDSLIKLKTSSDSIVEAAATRGKYKAEGGRETQMSLELINLTKENLNKLFVKFDKLLKVDYQP